jgi:hypothetical protein
MTEAMREVVAERGWVGDSVLVHALRWIERQGQTKKFEAYLKKAARDEEARCRDLPVHDP